MEVALGFESHAGRPLPPTQQSHFMGTEMSLQEKGRVVRPKRAVWSVWRSP